MDEGSEAELSQYDCLALLRTQKVGRIIFDDGCGATVRPVNYVVLADQIVLRMDRAFDAESRVLFEIDSVDTLGQQGWSVIVEGRAFSADGRASLEVELVEPWAPGGGKIWATTIVIDAISGRFVSAPRRASAPDERGYL